MRTSHLVLSGDAPQRSEHGAIVIITNDHMPLFSDIIFTPIMSSGRSLSSSELAIIPAPPLFRAQMTTKEVLWEL